MVKDTLEKTKKLVWPEIERYLSDPKYPKVFEIPRKFRSDLKFYWSTVREYPERKGKYLRPTLVLLTAMAMGLPPKKAIKTAAAMQISEDWLLIHDDIEDDSDMRRGLPALHKIFGVESAINAGDALHIIMWKLLFDNLESLGVDKYQAVLNEFYLMLKRTAVGQGIEIYWAKNDKYNLENSDWFFIADGKTSYYTIAGPMRLGVILAGANKKRVEGVTTFGLTLGRCFQLVDDLLDVTVREYKGRGQQTGNDIFESKKTLILGHLLRTASKADRQKVVKILSKSHDQKTQKEVDWIIGRMIHYGSINYAQNVARKYRDRARKIFDKKLSFLKNEPARTQLKELIDFILERKY